MSTWIGKTLGKVYIESLLARGGMAVVYLGMHTTLQRPVVVKFLRNNFEDDTDSIERFQREAFVVAKLRHPNIVQIFDFDTVEDQPYIVMEYIEGASLSIYLNALHGKLGRLALPQVSHVLTALASALQYAHESGVIHRDVKPANILLTSRSGQIVPGEPLPEDFEPVLSDFGLVRFLNESLQSSSGKLVGTPAYMSPEQARGESTDERTDIYSLGVVLYELLAGHIPFNGETTMSILLKHMNQPPPPVPALSASLQNVLDRALAKNPEDRFQTPNDFASAFNSAMDEMSNASTIALTKAVPNLPIKETNERPQWRKKWIQGALVGMGIIAMAASLLMNGQASPSNTSLTSSPSIETSIIGLTSLGPTGLLRFQDGNAIMDQAKFTAFAMPAPPPGSQYTVWLVNPENDEPLRLGILKLDGSGKGALVFDDDQDRNLLATYWGVEITTQPETVSTPESIPQLAYFYTLPESGLVYVRHLLVSFPSTPNQAALMQGMSANIQLIKQAVDKILKANQSHDLADVKKSAEVIMNLLAGSDSQEYKDWNEDRLRTDPGDGYGLLLNGDNLGYIQAVYSQADYTVNSFGVSQNIMTNGENVKNCVQNLASWASQLRENVLTILASEAELNESIPELQILADHMLNGTDKDKDGMIEPIVGECGMATAYEAAYRLADMPLLPVPSPDTSTPTSTYSIFPTRTSVRPSNNSDSLQNTPVPPQPTSRPKPTKKPPKPKNTPGN